MNIGSLIQMITDDPTILDDTKSFLQRINEQNQTQMVTKEIIVQEATSRKVSLAELNGGPCTQENIDAAQKLIAQQPLLDKAKAIADDLLAKVQNGEVQDVQGLADTLTAKAADVVKPDAPVDPILVDPVLPEEIK